MAVRIMRAITSNLASEKWKCGGTRMFSFSTTNAANNKPVVFPKVENPGLLEPGAGDPDDNLVILSKKQYRTAINLVKNEFKVWTEECKESFRNDPSLVIIPGEIRKIYPFTEDKHIEEWSVSSDSQEGIGFSKCSFTRSPSGRALFSGNLSTTLPDDGETYRTGFCSTHAPRAMKSFYRKSNYDWDVYTHIIFKVRGDGRSYLINLGTEGYFDLSWYDMYSYRLYTRGGPYWQISKIPFSKFIFGSKGYIQDAQDPINMETVTSFGLTIADGIDGPFQLEIDYIGLVMDHAHNEEHAYESYKLDSWMNA